MARFENGYLLFGLYDSIVQDLLQGWLSWKYLCLLDSSCCSVLSRKYFLSTLQTFTIFIPLCDDSRIDQHIFLIWVKKRRVHLRKLALFDFPFLSISDSIFDSINTQFLRSLDLGPCEYLSESLFCNSIHSCPNLTHLAIGYPGIPCRLSDQICYTIGETLLSLKSLHFTTLNRITNFGFDCILDRCMDLVDIRLHYCAFFDYASLRNIAKHCFNVERLSFRTSRLVSVNEILFLLHNCTTLKELEFRWRCSDSSIATLPRIQHEQTNQIRPTQYWDYCITDLDVSFCTGVNDKFLQIAAPYLTNLYSLDVSCCSNITMDGLLIVVNTSRKLQQLKLRQLQFDGHTLLSFTTYLPMLHYLCLSWTRLSDEQMLQIANTCDNLGHLSIAGCYEITVVGVQNFIDQCRNLKVLNISFCSKITRTVGDSNVLESNPDLSIITDNRSS